MAAKGACREAVFLLFGVSLYLRDSNPWLAGLESLVWWFWAVLCWFLFVGNSYVSALSLSRDWALRAFFDDGHSYAGTIVRGVLRGDSE